jgi:hypothetical protein
MPEPTRHDAADAAREREEADRERGSQADGDGGIARRLMVPFAVGVVVGAATVAVSRSSGYVKDTLVPKLEEQDVDGLAARGKQLAEGAKERVVDAGEAAASAAGGLVSKVTGDGGGGPEERKRTARKRRAGAGSLASGPRLSPEEREAARKEREARRAERRQHVAA